jgi:diguanylate cyclase (GGDEF)-like protein
VVLLALTVAAPATGQGAADAVDQARRALAAAEQNGSGELVAASLQELAASQERAGDFAGALDSYRRYHDVHERLISQDSHRRVQVLEDERYRFQRNLLGGSTLLLGLVALTIYRRRSASARLAEQLSVTDPLTGLKNRRYMRLTIGADIAACERKRRHAPSGVRPSDADLIFLLIDLDAFKAVNDEFGHQAGDQVLAQVADVLRESCRASDTIARWGADEFLVVSRFSDRRTGSVLGERIRAAVEHSRFRLRIPRH